MRLSVYLFIGVFLFTSCGWFNKDLKEEINNQNTRINEIESSNSIMRNQHNNLQTKYDSLQKENNILFRDIAKGMEFISDINSKLDEISALADPLIYKTEEEFYSNEREIDQKIRIIENHLRNTDNLIQQLRDSTSKIPQLEEFIIELRNKITEKNRDINNLKRDIAFYRNQVEIANKTIKEKQQEIDKLSKKQIIFVSKKETDFFNMNGSYIVCPYKFKEDEILTEHPSSSFNYIKQKRGKVAIDIHNKNKFWDESNFMIIKVNRKKLE